MDKERNRAPRAGKENVIGVRISCVGQVNMNVISAYLDKQMPFDTTVLEAISNLAGSPSFFEKLLKESQISLTIACA
jgi:hypothetical protein